MIVIGTGDVKIMNEEKWKGYSFDYKYFYKNMNSGNNSTLYKTYKKFSHKLNSILLIQQISQKIHYSNIKNQSK